MKVIEASLAAIILILMACQPTKHLRGYYASEDGQQVLWLDTAQKEALIMLPQERRMRYFNNNTGRLCFSYTVSGMSGVWHPTEPGLFAPEDKSARIGVVVFSPTELKNQSGENALAKARNMHIKGSRDFTGYTPTTIYIAPFSSSRYHAIRWGAIFPVNVKGQTSTARMEKIFVELPSGWVAQVTVQGTHDDERIAQELVETLAITAETEGYWPFIIEHYPAFVTEKTQSFWRDVVKKSESQTVRESTTTTLLDDARRAYDLGEYGKALQMLRQLAEQGIAWAQAQVGEMYEDGHSVPVDYAEAVSWYRLAVAQNFAPAQHNLGRMYFYGLGVPQDYSEAGMLWRLAADQGDMLGQFGLGKVYAEGRGVPRDEDESAKWYRLSATQGNSDAQLELGCLFLGSSRNQVEAAKWFRQAAEQGDAIAQNNLANMYMNGVGLEQDFSEAARWFQLSANQGVAEAQHSLGHLYRKGVGVPQNFSEAAKWYRRAAERGLAQAQYSLALRLHADAASHQKGAKMCDEILMWYRCAAEQANAAAMLSIGEIHYYGECVERDLERAYFWLSLAIRYFEDESKDEANALKKELSSQMTSEQIKTAEDAAQSWEPRVLINRGYIPEKKHN